MNSVPPVAFPPEPKGAYVGQDNIPDDVRRKIYAEGARTVPGREHGGNCDVSKYECFVIRCRCLKVARQIKNLSRGSRCYFPVFVEGANLSVGDLHFSQGDVSHAHNWSD